MSPHGRPASVRGPYAAPDRELDAKAVTRQLLDPLTDDQQLVVNLVADAFYQCGQQWPKFQYVEAVLDRERLDARSVLATFPVAGTSINYAAVSCTPRTASLSDDTQVGLTLLGLHHYKGPFKGHAESLVRDGLRLLQVFVDARRVFTPPPTEVKYLQLSGAEVLARLRPNAPRDLPSEAVLDGIVHAEPPLLSCVGGSRNDGRTWAWTVSRGNLLEFDGIDGVLEEYVRRIVRKYHVFHRVERPVLASPLTLPSALGYLDTAWRVMAGREVHLVVLPSPERAAALAFDAGTRAEFLERIGALGDVLKCLNVPAGGDQKGGHPLERLRAFLLGRLPSESHELITRALDQLVAVKDIRNGGLHAEAEPAALRAYQALGVAFPITNPAAAWDAVRIATVGALDAIREEVLSYVGSRAAEPGN